MFLLYLVWQKIYFQFSHDKSFVMWLSLMINKTLSEITRIPVKFCIEVCEKVSLTSCLLILIRHEALVYSNDNLCKLWHKRFNHLHYEALPLLKHMVQGLSDFKLEKMGMCKGCTLDKHAKTAFPSNEYRARGLLDLIHSNVCGSRSSTILIGRSIMFISLMILLGKARFTLWKPRMTSLVLFCLVTWIYTRQPKTQKCDTYDFLPVKSSFGVLSFNILWGHLFKMQTTILHAFSQSWSDRYYVS